MRYELGYMDLYPIEAAGSKVENNPMYRVLFRESIDREKLEKALREALAAFPLFATKVGYDGEYYLEDNDAPLIILNCSEAERPKTFGANTNGYPWRMCIDGRLLMLEWLHGVTDGMGALTFLKYVLCRYFGVDTAVPALEDQLAPGLSPFMDKKEKGSNWSVDPTGFRIKDFPELHELYKTDCHLLHADTSEILKTAKECGTSVAPLLSVLFARALRIHLPLKARNRKVACNVVMDFRRPLNYVTMHNCVEYKRLTYFDSYDEMSLAEVAREYRTRLDSARNRPNVIRAITERQNLFKAYHALYFKSKRLLKGLVKLIGSVLKYSDCNFVFTYPGKIELPPEAAAGIEDFEFKVWHDFGECIIAAVDFEGRFTMNISENFAGKGVVEDFIRLSAEAGIHWTEESCTLFEQSHFAE